MSVQTILCILMFSFCCLGAVFFYFAMRSRFSSKRVLADIRAEMDRLLADLEFQVDRDVRVLESRTAALRAMIDEADRRIVTADREGERRRFEAAALKSVSTQPLGATVAAQDRPPSHTAPASAMSSASIVPPVSAMSSTSTMPEASAVPQAVEPPARPATPERPSPPVSASARAEPVTIYTKPMIRRSAEQIEPVVPVAERVLDMNRKGFSNEMIAATLAVSLGEVELILDMNGSS